MITRKLIVATLVLAMQIQFGTTRLNAQEFAITPWVGTRDVAAPSAWRTNNRPAGFDGDESTSYRVERDPRYLQAVRPVRPASYQTRPAQSPYYALPVASISYAAATPNTSYYPDWQPSHGGALGQPNYVPVPSCQFGTAPPVGRPYPFPAPLPKGYHKGDGLFGKDTVYADGQPIRNLFRFLAP